MWLIDQLHIKLDCLISNCNTGQWEGDCGLWVLNEIIKKTYTESLKKIVGAVSELPAE